MRLIVSAGLAFLAACSPADVEHAVEAAFLALDIAAGSRPSLYKEWKDEPRREEIAYSIDGRNYRADLYHPKTPRAALVLVPGLHREGWREAHLRALATTLGRAGFAVLVPDLPNYRQLMIGASDPVGIADAARHLTGRAEGASKIGIAGISYASGPAFLAALEDDIADRVGFVFVLGGYFDLDSVLTYIVTARFRESPDSPWQIGGPNNYGSWLFIRANAARLDDPADRRQLQLIADRRLGNPMAPVDDLMAGCGPDCASVMALLGEVDPDRVPDRVAALPDGLRTDFQALTLKDKPLDRLKGRAILLHGRDDAIVPYTESLALARRLGVERAELHLARRLAHVDFDPEGLSDGVAVWRAGLSLLRQRD